MPNDANFTDLYVYQNYPLGVKENPCNCTCLSFVGSAEMRRGHVEFVHCCPKISGAYTELISIGPELILICYFDDTIHCAASTRS